ncbi:salicylate hydroxylase [Roseibium denhamense]|uniref:Salicylate hydroxylase n=1 Tax=Roseibium denhamense TaxID=76305 RepID=A0ABY1N6A1_9HYPH|nr:FAD-dependent monooxygenase [Roseibium denhamense]MTI04396.1 salicylate hydroxylase [Roseibium denhamense]SMP00632.1 salicylate hydroxylase [Roseibium denhamense]
MSETPSSAPIVIAGAGIGGLSAALALRKAGHEIVVLERATNLKEVGAGLQLSPNACAVLAQLGLLDALAPKVYAPPNLEIWSGQTGDKISRVELGGFLKTRHGNPFWVVHRADLQNVLLEAASSDDGIRLIVDTTVEDITASPFGGLTCSFHTGGNANSQTCKALIGADGVWSKTRKLVPEHQNARFSGQVAYRATVPIENVPERWHKNSGLWLHKRSHLVHYPIRDGQLLNIVALVEEPWQDETWSAPARQEDLIHNFRHWPSDVRNLLNAPDSWLKWALCSVDASGPWTHGHVALLGDSAHAMLPYMAQGAAMAIEDAAVLAHHLPPNTENIPAALRAYEESRKARVRTVQAQAFRNARTFHMDGILAAARNTVLRLSGAQKLAARFDNIYGWTPPQ